MKRVNGLKIIIWNARGWSNKKEELQRHIQDFDINIVTEIKCRMIISELLDIKVLLKIE